MERAKINAAYVARIRALERALDRGRARLVYDVQSYWLGSPSSPAHFVRAWWVVDGRQAFALSVWLRGDRLAESNANLRPAAWLRMGEFQGRIDNEHLGLVLNTFEMSGESYVLTAQGGYESMGLLLHRHTPEGLTPTTIGYSYGC